RGSTFQVNRSAVIAVPAAIGHDRVGLLLLLAEGLQLVERLLQAVQLGGQAAEFLAGILSFFVRVGGLSAPTMDFCCQVREPTLLVAQSVTLGLLPIFLCCQTGPCLGDLLLDGRDLTTQFALLPK